MTPARPRRAHRQALPPRPSTQLDVQRAILPAAGQRCWKASARRLKTRRRSWRRISLSDGVHLSGGGALLDGPARAPFRDAEYSRLHWRSTRRTRWRSAHASPLPMTELTDKLADSGCPAGAVTAHSRFRFTRHKERKNKWQRRQPPTKRSSYSAEKTKGGRTAKAGVSALLFVDTAFLSSWSRRYISLRAARRRRASRYVKTASVRCSRQCRMRFRLRPSNVKRFFTNWRNYDDASGHYDRASPCENQQLKPGAGEARRRPCRKTSGCKTLLDAQRHL